MGDTVIHVVCIVGDTVIHVVCIVGYSYTCSMHCTIQLYMWYVLSGIQYYTCSMHCAIQLYT